MNCWTPPAAFSLHILWTEWQTRRMVMVNHSISKLSCWLFKYRHCPAHTHIEYIIVAIWLYNPNLKHCFHCQIFKQTQQQYASSLACVVCCETGYGNAPYPNPPLCFKCSGNHSCGNKSCPTYLTRKSTHECMLFHLERVSVVKITVW